MKIVFFLAIGVCLCVILGILTEYGNSNNTSDINNDIGMQNTSISLSGKYYIVVSGDISELMADTYFNFYGNNDYTFFYNGNEGVGTYRINGNLLSITGNSGSSKTEFTVSTDYQTLIATDGSITFKKDVLGNKTTFTVLSGTYYLNPNSYSLALRPDGSTDNSWDGRYYQFFDDNTYKDVYPNRKDSSAGGTYRIEKNIITLYQSHDSSYRPRYIISPDGNILTDNSHIWEKN